MPRHKRRAIEINVAGPFARSKIAWKLAVHQHGLLHRLVALMNGTSVAWNKRQTLPAILTARALMETVAVTSALAERVADALAAEDLGALDALAERGTFSSRDAEWLREAPETKAVNVLTYIDRFDKRAEGFRGHYDILSERCHPNALGHNFMFAMLDRSDGSVRFFDEREPERNCQMILAGAAPDTDPKGGYRELGPGGVVTDGVNPVFHQSLRAGAGSAYGYAPSHAPQYTKHKTK